MAPRKAAPKPAPDTTAATKKSGSEPVSSAADGAGDAGGEGECTDHHGPLGPGPPHGQRAEQAGAVERQDQQAADEVVVDAEHSRDERGPERGVEPAQRPGGRQARQHREEGAALCGGDVHPRAGATPARRVVGGRTRAAAAPRRRRAGTRRSALPNTQSVGPGTNSTSSPAPTAPRESPSPGEALLTRGPSGRSLRWKSSSAAPSAPVIAPVARPCTTRAAISQPTPSARRKSTIAPAWSTSAPARTGRRPTWSESAPDHQQRGEQREGVDAEHRRQDAGAEAEPLLVHAVERRGDAGRGEHQHEEDGDRPEGGRPGRA